MLSKKRRKALEPCSGSYLTRMPTLESDRQWRHLAHRRNRFLELCIGTHACALLLLYPLVHIGSRSPLLWPIFAGMLALSVAWVGSGCLALRCQSQLVAHVQQTFLSKDIRNLNCWIDLLFASGAQACNNGKWDHVRAAAGARLRKYLPLLNEETASLLNAHDRRALYKALRGQNTELISLVLQVAPLLGDACALPYVQHLADGKGTARKHPELQAKARSVLPNLQARVALSSSTAGLLRASQPPPTPPEELLLPAEAHNATDPTELLRAENRK